jgi:hypothetical protein
VLLPCTQKVRDGELWVRSAVSLRAIAGALRAYHEANGRLPPAAVTGEGGRPLYSWRVLLLPYLEQEDLYRRFRLDEPWDGPNNRALLDRTPRYYEPALGGFDPPGMTRYQVFVGPGTAFERDGLTWDDFPAGPGGTILAAEGGEPVPWSKPAELAYDPDGPLPKLGGAYTRPAYFLCYEVQRESGFTCCFGDGTARFIPSTGSERNVRRLITRGDSR